VKRCALLVRIYTRIIKKRYLNEKRVYKHKYVAVPIPSRFHELLQPFLRTNLEITVNASPNELTIILTPKKIPEKKLLRDENTPIKTRKKTTKNSSRNDKS
jgi:hypothetical protein